MKLHTASLLASVLSLAVAGCGGNTTPEPETPLTADPPPMSEPVAATPPPPPAETAATPPPPPAEAPLTDENIAAIITTVNNGEIEQAKLAQTNAKDQKVKQFAQLMIQHHTKGNQDAQKILAKNNMTPADNEISTKLASDSKSMVESWKPTKGADFDRAYIEAQVKQHQDVLAMIDAKLLPQVKNEEMKQALTAFRPVVEAHLKQAQDIQGKLAGTPAGGAAPAGGGSAPGGSGTGGTKAPAGGGTTPPASGGSSSVTPPAGATTPASTTAAK